MIFVQERAVTQVLDGSSVLGDRHDWDLNESHNRVQDSREVPSPARNFNRVERTEYYQDPPARQPIEEMVAHSQFANRLSNEPNSVSFRDRHERRSGSEDSEGASAGVGLVIGNDLANPDPVSKIILISTGF